MRLQKKLILLGVITVLLGMLLTGCGKKKINLNDYISVSFSGYEGYGQAIVEFDEEKFEADCEGIKITNSNVSMLYGNAAEYYDDFCFKYSVSENELLSNGNTITLTWNCEDGLVENNTSGILVYSDMTFEVKGLEVLPTFDVFEGVEVTFSGYAPGATISIKENNDYFNFKVIAVNGQSVDSAGDLSMGDVVTINAQASILCPTLQDYIETNKKVPESLTKEYEVTGVGKYVQTQSDVSQEILAGLNETSFSTMQNQWDKYYDNPNNYSAEYVGMVVCKENFWLPNDLWLVYKITSVDESEPIYYWAAEFRGVTISVAGEFEYKVVSVPEAPSWGVGGEVFKASNGLSYIGYETLDVVYDAIMVSKWADVDNYDELDTDIPELIR